MSDSDLSDSDDEIISFDDYSMFKCNYFSIYDYPPTQDEVFGHDNNYYEINYELFSPKK